VKIVRKIDESSRIAYAAYENKCCSMTIESLILSVLQYIKIHKKDIKNSSAMRSAA